MEGPFDLKENFLIKEPSVVLLLLELLPNLSEPLQVSKSLILEETCSTAHLDNYSERVLTVYIVWHLNHAVIELGP